ncbi:anion transporter, partial [Candidatus Bathyarchaeota archaeon]|nr:anion transporter [Candidatus Bathyarchaeota archaeon]
LILILILITTRIIIVFIGIPVDFRLTYISLLAALPILLFSPKRFSLIRGIDWRTLIFFASMFIMMESVWNTGFFQSIMAGLNLNLTTLPAVFSVSILLSQLISNVPLVALYLPMLIHEGAATKELMALAAGNTIAGNLSILGAASNIIIIQNAEKRAHESITFLEFVKVGAPLTLLNTLIYWVFLTLM